MPKRRELFGGAVRRSRRTQSSGAQKTKDVALPSHPLLTPTTHLSLQHCMLKWTSETVRDEGRRGDGVPQKTPKAFWSWAPRPSVGIWCGGWGYQILLFLGNRRAVCIHRSLCSWRTQFMDPFPKVGLYETLQLLVLEARLGNLSTYQGSAEEEQLRHEGNVKLD